MTVTHPKGFRAAGISVGLKSTGKPDLALVVNDGEDPRAAVVFTSNRAQANPILWSKEAVRRATPRAVILNSGGANCFTGDFGFETAQRTAEQTAKLLRVTPHEVLVCSTGLIGVGGEDFRSKILDGIPTLVNTLSHNDEQVAAAILTTDSVEKTATYTHASGWSLGAIAKGAGMLAPGLATMLVVITTDAVVGHEALQRALTTATHLSVNRLDSDGCMSTNDQVTLLGSGASGVEADEVEFAQQLTLLMQDLAQQLQQDAEGASHDIDIEVVGAAHEQDAEVVGRALARNNLFKAAIFGNDPNWGRVLAAIGTTDAHFDPYNVDVSFNGVRLCTRGGPDRPVEECDLTPRRTHVLIDLHAGEHSATILTNDLTHDYVHENSAYSS